LANQDTFCLLTHRDDPPHNLMAGNAGVNGVAPFICEHGKIGMTDTAMLDGNLDLFRREGAWIELVSFQWISGRKGGPGTNPAHNASSEIRLTFL